VQYGCNVSHANNKLTKRFLPNLQSVSFFSERLGRTVRVRATPHGIRSVEANGGFDSYLLKTSDASLGKRVIAIKRRLRVKEMRKEI
jgi:large subunit ribosomal protein L28